MEAFRVDVRSISAIWGFGDDDVWAGGGGALLHWNGSGQWSRYPAPSGHRVIYDIWGCASNDVWALTNAGMINFDGNEWSEVSSHLGISLRGVFGVACDDVWAVGSTPWSSDPPLAHWDGTTWTVVDSDRFVAPSGVTLSSVWGPSADDLWAVGSAGWILRWDGSVWARVFEDELADMRWIDSVGGRHAHDVWVVGQHMDGSGAKCRWNGAAWSCTKHRETLTFIHSAGPLGLFALGNRGYLAFENEGEWIDLTYSEPHLRHVTAMDGSSVSDVVAVGTGVWRWDGSRWSSVFEDMPYDLRAVTCDHDGVCFAAGSTGTGVDVIVRLEPDGESWTIEYEIEGVFLLGIWGESAQGVWAVGNGATVLHRSPSGQWRSIDDLPEMVSPSAQLSDVLGTSPEDVWIVGTAVAETSGIVLHWDGQSWSLDSYFFSHFPRGVRLAGDESFIVGENGDGDPFIWHDDGTGWKPFPVQPDFGDEYFAFTSVWSTEEGELFVGSGGDLFKWDGEAWTRPASQRNLAAWGIEDALWLHGDGVLVRTP